MARFIKGMSLKAALARLDIWSFGAATQVADPPARIRHDLPGARHNGL